MNFNSLLAPITTDHLQLRNRVVMAPMNRRRAPNGIPGPSAALYYAQRASAGLIITDNTAIAPNAIGYLNTPGIYNDRQIEGWKKVAQAVHDKGGKIFMQLVHTGRIGHINNNDDQMPLVAPSNIPAKEFVRTKEGHLPMSTPVTLSVDEISVIIKDHATAARKAIDAGFDGVEIHGAHGFLAEQFLHPLTNQRTDLYGGNMVNRSRFLLETLSAVSEEIGREKTGVRLSPFATVNDLPAYTEEANTHLYLASEINKIGILYLHLSDLSPAADVAISPLTIQALRKKFSGLLIVAGNYTPNSGNDIIESGLADLVAFGRPYISNPDLVERFRSGAPLANGDPSTYYEGGESGYTDYETFKDAIF